MSGALWSIGLRWGMRMIGFLSTLIVARLLLPSDYGIVAMAVMVTGLIQTFLDANASTALLRAPDATREYVDSAWTLAFVQSLVVATVMAILAPFAASYFNEPRLANVLWATAPAIVLGGAASVGPLLARKCLDYSLEVKLALLSRVVSFVATVGLAWWWRSYWALVLGGLAGAIVGFVAGYLFHPFRPRLEAKHLRDLMGFSQWMIVSGIGVYGARKLDGFVIGRVGTAADVGLYNVGMELGQMLPTELGAPMSRALLPILASLHGEPARMRTAVMKTTAAMNTLTLPAGVGLALVHCVIEMAPRLWSDSVDGKNEPDRDRDEAVACRLA